MIDLFDQIVRRADAGEPVAVCILVRTRGSTPQKAGAVMVVLRDGQTLGTIGGGCVEAEVRTRALRFFDELVFKGQLLTFKLDHDYGWDDGLVCGGAMDVAVQVISSPAGAMPFQAARDGLLAGGSVILPIAVPDEQGAITHFDQRFDTPAHLVIAGAGHVGHALAAIASHAGFDVTIIDDRPDMASPARFPDATRIVGAVDTELARIAIDTSTYVVIVTRGHRNDALALAAVVNSDAKYVGLIGSKRKVVTIYDELMRQGVSFDRLERVHAPIGLDIRAVTPGEIAVSIAAELIAVRRGIAGQPVGAMKLPSALLERLRLTPNV